MITPVELFNAFATAALVTLLFRMRYRTWDNPRVMGAYFALFFTLDVAAHAFFITPGTFGASLGIVLSGIAVLVYGATRVIRRLEETQDRDRLEG